MNLTKVMTLLTVSGKEEEKTVSSIPTPVAATQARTKDDAYDQFMKEMEDLF